MYNIFYSFGRKKTLMMLLGLPGLGHDEFKTKAIQSADVTPFPLEQHGTSFWKTAFIVNGEREIFFDTV